jgi:uncharacterized protein with ATP-grasp and redox domains
MNDHLPGPECPECLRRLAQSTLDLCSIRGAAREELNRAGEEMLARGLASRRAPALIANEFLALMRRSTGCRDPLAAKKAADIRAARRAVAALGPVPDDLATRVRAAIMGNSLDHFLVTDPDRFWAGGLDRDLAVDHLPRLESYLRPDAAVTMLADNAGEQCFDRLLVEHLQGRGCRVTYVVKSGPAQNDLTLQDIREHGEDFGLGRIVETGTAQVGIDPEEIPDHLARLLNESDLVIAKGMGHYETLHRVAGLTGEGPSPWPLLFLLLAKCPPVARSLRVDLGAGVALLAPKDLAAGNAPSAAKAGEGHARRG